MIRITRVLSLLMLMAGVACSKPKPVEPDPIKDLAQKLKNTPRPSLLQFEELAKTLDQNAAAAPVAPPATPDFPAGPPIASPEDFTVMIRKAGYDPHPNDPGYMPYFDAMDSSTATGFGLPDRLRIMYGMSTQGRLLFVAVVRPLRGAEEPTPEEMFQKNLPLAADLLAKLHQVVPPTQSLAFAAKEVPMGMMGDTEVLRARLLVAASLPNRGSNPAFVTEAFGLIMMALDKTKAIWR